MKNGGGVAEEETMVFVKEARRRELLGWAVADRGAET